VAARQKLSESQHEYHLVVDNIRPLDYEIYAIPEGAIADELEEHGDDVKVILLGPQVSFMRKAAEKTAAPYHIPVDVVNVRLYGTANGEKILEHALKLANES